MTIPDVSPELPPLHWRSMLQTLRLLPQGALSRGFGHIADVPLPRPLRHAVLGGFARMMGIGTTEAELPIGEYGSINAFFVRRLRAGARSIDARADQVVSPVDGVVGQLGRVFDGVLVQAKGRTYSVTSLLRDAAMAQRFEGGSYVTIYLSPRHYHRIHAPDAGGITAARHVPGALMPVNEPSVMHVDQLFPRNERLICHMQCAHGALAVVAVGAYNVGRISAAFDPAWRDGASITNVSGATEDVRTYVPPLPIARGEEIMAFHLGSTIVMLLESAVEFNEGITPGREIPLGSALGTITRPGSRAD